MSPERYKYGFQHRAAQLRAGTGIEALHLHNLFGDVAHLVERKEKEPSSSVCGDMATQLEVEMNAVEEVQTLRLMVGSFEDDDSDDEGTSEWPDAELVGILRCADSQGGARDGRMAS
ncbi:hypothetical protein NFJ02_10g02510 [Pycnococcus provasolii]